MPQFRESRFFSVLAVFCMISFIGLVTASSAPDDTVGKQMRKVKKAMKTLHKIAADPAQKSAAMEAASSLQSAALAAKGLLPRNAKRMEDPKAKAEFIAGFRKAQIAFIKTSLDLELAIMDGDKDKVATLLQALEGMEQRGHKTFKKRRQ